jgi:alkanesulfonate monooxygenase SsuD/methylene tetrahydromethanopterin reductase-like flavin-dependent oxidoreductase (luciferase family)
MNAYGALSRSASDIAPEDAEAVAKLREASAGAYLTEAGYHDLVPERWVDRFAVAGTPEDVRARLEQAVEQGADEVAMILMGSRSHERGAADQLTLFADRVMRPMQESVGVR